MTAQEFAALFALAQAAPGPNMLVATLVGWRVAGVPGALVATLALCGPSCTLTYVTAGAWHRFRTADWRAVVQGGLVPVTVGLVAAGAAVLVQSTTLDWRTALVTLVVAALVLRTRLNPLWMLTGAAALGLLGVL
jgi:chromate transporter